MTIDSIDEVLSRLRKYLDEVKGDSEALDEVDNDNDNDNNRNDKDDDYDKDGDDDKINGNKD